MGGENGYDQDMLYICMNFPKKKLVNRHFKRSWWALSTKLFESYSSPRAEGEWHTTSFPCGDGDGSAPLISPSRFILFRRTENTMNHMSNYSKQVERGPQNIAQRNTTNLHLLLSKFWCSKFLTESRLRDRNYMRLDLLSAYLCSKQPSRLIFHITLTTLRWELVWLMTQCQQTIALATVQ